MLSEREKEIMLLIYHEYSSSEIATKLNISVGTVFTHRKRILEKLGVSNSIGMIKYAIFNGLVAKK
jgi:DNA-binding CsgD family transcriptional regulator